MPYALFVEDHQISRALPTENDVWHYADDAGLVVDALIQDSTGKPERVLEQGTRIREAERKSNGRCRGCQSAWREGRKHRGEKSQNVSWRRTSVG